MAAGAVSSSFDLINAVKVDLSCFLVVVAVPQYILRVSSGFSALRVVALVSGNRGRHCGIEAVRRAYAASYYRFEKP